MQVNLNLSHLCAIIKSELINTNQDARVGRELVGRGQDRLRLVVDRLRLHEDHIVVGGGLEII